MKTWAKFIKHFFFLSSYEHRDNKKDSYQLPAYGVFNANASYRFMLAKDLDAKVYIQGYNLANVSTPVEGWGDDKDSFKGFWSWGRNFNFGVKVNF